MTQGSKNRALEKLRPYEERARRMRGWSWEIQSVSLGPDIPWSYTSRARELLARARSVVDMGTGGGEAFGDLCDGYPGFAVATEGWSGNVLVAAERLSPSGIPVVHASSLQLPFADGSFELILNRHEELSPEEVARVLAPGGYALTQQVGRNNWQELFEFFPRMHDFGPHFELYQDGFRAGGLNVTRAESHNYLIAFPSLGEVVYMLTAAPWTIPDFDLERDLDALLALERSAKREEGIVFTESRYIIEAYKDVAPQ